MAREKISARYRFQILERDEFKCFYCHAPNVTLQIDHVVPYSRGGTNAPWNLVAACVPCNGSKTNFAPSEEVVQRVREAQLGWLIQHRNSTFAACVHCATPINLDGWEDRDYIECESCNLLSCNSYDAGYAQALRNAGVA